MADNKEKVSLWFIELLLVFIIVLLILIAFVIADIGQEIERDTQEIKESLVE